MRAKVKTCGELSTEFDVFQGVKQSGRTSTDDYKQYINDLLLIQENSDLGFKIGGINIGNPACADDVVLMSDNLTDMATMIAIASRYANTHQYSLHPQKSVTSIYNISSNFKDMLKEDCPISINQEPLTISDSITHLGIDRYCSNSKFIDDRISLARRAMYGLFGAGLHGLNSQPVSVCLKLDRIYIVPRLLYGLDVVNLSNGEINKLEVFHKQNIRCLQNLPTRTATFAVYLLVNEIPVRGHLEINKLSFFGSIARSSSMVKDLAIRQMLIKEDQSNSWFIGIKQLLSKYELDDPLVILSNPLSKTRWKNLIKNRVKSHYFGKLIEESSDKSSLKMH